MSNWDNLGQNLANYGMNILAAVAILVVGWVLAWVISSLVKRGLSKTNLHRRVASDVSGAGAETTDNVDRWISSAVFLVLMVFVLVAMFEALLLESIKTPLSEMLTVILDYAPRIAGAVAVLAGAWVLATILHKVIRRSLEALKLESRIGSDAVPADQSTLAGSIANTVYWLTFLLFLPALLGVLQLEGLLGPVERMVDKVLNYLPNVALAVIVLAVGWLAARLVQRLVTQLLSSAGFDKLASNYHVDEVVGQGKQPSAAVGIIVYVLILLPVIVAALNALQIQAVTEPAQHMLDLIIGAIPRIFAAAGLLAVSYIAARVASSLVTQLLSTIGFDTILTKLGLQTQEVPETGGRTPSQVAGYLVIVAVLLFAGIEALALLEFNNLASLVEELLVFFGQILVGLVVIGIAVYLANLAANTIKASKTKQADRLALLARVAVVALGLAMGLQQMGIANQIINLAFGLILGAVAVAGAIAFGLGGRDLAAKELEKWRDSK